MEMGNQESHGKYLCIARCQVIWDASEAYIIVRHQGIERPQFTAHIPVRGKSDGDWTQVTTIDFHSKGNLSILSWNPKEDNACYRIMLQNCRELKINHDSTNEFVLPRRTFSSNWLYWLRGRQELVNSIGKFAAYCNCNWWWVIHFQCMAAGLIWLTRRPMAWSA